MLPFEDESGDMISIGKGSGPSPSGKGTPWVDQHHFLWTLPLFLPKVRMKKEIK